MVKKTTLKLFLTSGITLTVGSDEEIYINGDGTYGLHDLADLVKICVETKAMLEFTAELKHEYDELGEIKTQKVTHHYSIPSDRISWFMIEEV